VRDLVLGDQPWTHLAILLIPFALVALVALWLHRAIDRGGTRA
jgi:hypothetical protein